MTEHRIRFRGGWEIRPGLGQVSDRITLPVHWPDEFAAIVELTRSFGKPRLSSSDEKIKLELLQVPGLLSLELNGEELGIKEIRPGIDPLLIEVALQARNQLKLRVDLDLVRQSALAEAWGFIALVIASKSENPH